MLSVKKQFEKFVLCWLATASKTGAPNVSPKELFIYPNSNEIWIANIASPQSIRNIQENPHVCISGIDIWTQKGLQCKGQAQIIEPQSKNFSKMKLVFEALNPEQYRILQIIKIQIEKVKEIVAPSYVFNPKTSEASQIKASKQRYKINQYFGNGD